MAVEYSMRISRLTVDKHMTVGRRVTMSRRTDAEGAGRDLLLIDRCGGIPARHPTRLSTSPGAGAIVRCDSNPRSGATTSGRRLPSKGSTLAISWPLSWHPDRPRSGKQGRCCPCPPRPKFAFASRSGALPCSTGPTCTDRSTGRTGTASLPSINRESWNRFTLGMPGRTMCWEHRHSKSAAVSSGIFWTASRRIDLHANEGSPISGRS